MIQLDVFGISDSKTSRRVWAAAPIHQRTVQVCKIPWYSLNWISKEFVFYERLGIGFSTAKEMLKVKKKPSIYLEKHWWSEIRVTPRRQHIFLSSPLLGSLHILARHLAVAGQQRRQNNKTNGRKKCTWLICCAISLTFVPSWSQMRLQLLHFYAVFKRGRHFKNWRPSFRSGGSSTEFQRK